MPLFSPTERASLQMGSSNCEPPEGRISWHGPPIAQASIDIIEDYPVWAELPPQKPYNLAKVAYKVILINADGGRRYFVGHLYEFFMCNFHTPSHLRASEEAFYTPRRFLAGLFQQAIQARLGIPSHWHWTLWMVMDKDHPCIKLADEQGIRDGLEFLQQEYLKKQRFKHHIVCFIVQLDLESTKSGFTSLPQPRRPSIDDEFDENRVRIGDEYNYNEEYAREDDEHARADREVHHSPDAFDHDHDKHPLENQAVADVFESAQTVPPEPVQVSGVLESLDTDSKKGDVVDGDLESILPVTGSPSEEEWKDEMSFLGLNPEDHKDPTVFSIQVPHTNILLTPRQYRAAYFILACRETRGIYGGILADIPGSGKTYSCLAALLFRALVAYNMAEVKKEWDQREFEANQGKVSKSRTHKHLPPYADPRDVCPCNNSLGILCYAVPRGATRYIGDTLSRGPSLILAPQGVIEEWKKVMTSHSLNRKYFEPSLIHTIVHRDLSPPPDFSKRFSVVVTPKQLVHPEDHNLTVTDCDFIYKIDSEPGKQPERYIILTTHQIELLRKTFQYPVAVAIGGKRERQTVYGLPAGCMLVDEFHKVRTMTGPVVTLAEETKRIKRFATDFWSVTGTICPSNSLMDLESTVAILQRGPWTQPTHRYYKSRPEELRLLEEAYRSAVSATGSQEAVEAFRAKVHHFFEGLIMRHTMESRFFGKQVSWMKEVQPIKKTFTTPLEFASALDRVAVRVRDRISAMTGPGNYDQIVRSLDTYKELTPLQFISTFPGATNFVMLGIPFDAQTLREFIRKERGDVANVKDLTDMTDTIINGSPKLEAIFDLFLLMEEDFQSRPQKPDGAKYGNRDDRQMKKMVIVTPTLAEAVFVYLGLRKKLPRGPKVVVLFHADLLSSEKMKMLNDFQALTPGSPKVLVTPYEVGGTGLNLQVANYEVLTGPLRTKDHETQAFARTNRQGSVLKLHHFLYLVDDNPADRLIVARHANRRIISDPFDIDAKLEVDMGEEDGRY